MGTKRYQVRLVRPVFQVVVVDVEAEHEEDAMLAALVQAGTIPEKEWTGAFDADNYFYDAQDVSEAGEPGADHLPPGGENRQYLLLRADTASGEGEIVSSPWLDEISDLMMTDLCTDWSSQLDELAGAGGSRFYESLEEHVPGRNRIPAKVIPFRRPANKDADN